MEIVISYVPTRADRKLEVRSSVVNTLRHWWLIGAPLAAGGVGLLATMAASPQTSLITGCAALGAWAGILIMVYPYRRVEEAVRHELNEAPEDAREITLSTAGIQLRVPGASSIMTWSKVCTIAETATHWSITFDVSRTLHLPKRAVSEQHAEQVSRLLREVKAQGTHTR
ncbi:YcxB family protein [Nonomuraea gerenzanensis]|uniref:YcxB family protein n=1 Tax=Nonomuraea gerenzanensis TaxID=93944 RepID=UPI001CD91C2E|nr:YcxB family protein [Nonomuraea gerenzanensis]UBU12524.1 YcxB family protein [Nonomuraea gerenzanensis]